MSRVALLVLILVSTSIQAKDFITQAASSDLRSSEAKARDEYRHPQQTLRFFGLQPEMTVVEIWPGGGWYADILAPLVSGKGQYIAAHFLIDDDTPEFFVNSRQRFEQRIAQLEPYSGAQVTSFHPTKSGAIADKGSADMVLTFRNVHNWYMRQGQTGMDKSFKAFSRALKKGGILGVVEHRLPEDMADELQKTSGYMKQSAVIKSAQKAGFKLVASSEINANPNDTADHPNGVWTLPPRLRTGDEPFSKYLAIGESDRMTLKFIKQ